MLHCISKMQYRCLAHLCNLINHHHLGIPEYPKVFCNEFHPNNDITHMQISHCNFAQLLFWHEQNYLRFLTSSALCYCNPIGSCVNKNFILFLALVVHGVNSQRLSYSELGPCWGIPSSDGIPIGAADFFFFFFFSFRRRKWHFWRPNAMKETLYWPGILGKASYG